MTPSINDIMSHQRLLLLLLAAPSVFLYVLFAQVIQTNEYISFFAGVVGFLLGFFIGVRIETLDYMKKWYGKLCYFSLGLFFPLVFLVKMLSSDAGLIFILFSYGLFFLILHSHMIKKSLDNYRRNHDT